MNVIPRLQKGVSLAFRRNLGISAVVAQKAVASDQVQKLFIQMIKEYDQKSKASPGKLVDSTPEVEKQLKQELERIVKVFGGGAGVDMTKFPSFDFKDPQLDPINQGAAQ